MNYAAWPSCFADSQLVGAGIPDSSREVGSLSTSYFSQHEFVQETPVQAGSWTLESQQAALLELLRGVSGAPVSFADLNAAGIEFPASVVSELELAGVEIERCVLARTQAGLEPRPDSVI
jgi:hypothetical protein